MPTHLFIEIKKNKIEVGEQSSKKFKKQILKTFPKEAIGLKQLSEMVLSDSSENVLLYLHGIWGNFKFFHRSVIKKIDTLEGIDKTISIIWHPAKFRYQPSWKKAIEQGEEIAILLQNIFSNNRNTYSLLCHSMGHRFLEGALKKMDLSKVEFKTVFLAAPDLDMDVFSKNLAALPSISKKIILFNHKRDRSLKLSRMIHKRDRLGLNAIEQREAFKEIKNLEIVDISDWKEGRGFVFLNHNYFKGHQQVLKRFEKELMNQHSVKNTL